MAFCGVRHQPSDGDTHQDIATGRSRRQARMKPDAATTARLAELLQRLERAAGRIERGISAAVASAPGSPSDHDELRRAQAEISTLRALNETMARRVQAAIDRARAALDE
jgi:hypothetical protein